MRTSPSPSLGSPRPSALTAAAAPSDDPVITVMNALRAFMVQHITAVFAEKEAEITVQSSWDKIWGPGRLRTSMEMWRGKCFSQISRTQWPGSAAAIRAEVLQAFTETCIEQVDLLKEEEEA